MTKPIYIMIHHTGVSYTVNPDQVEATNNYHKGLKFPKSTMRYYAGYNYEIALNGKVTQTRRDGETTAACKQADMNSGKCIHIAIDGNFDKEKMADKQVFALRDLLRRLVKEYDIDIDCIVPHKSFAVKTCPGKNVDISFVRSLAKEEFKDGSENNEEVKKRLLKINKDISEAVKLL